MSTFYDSLPRELAVEFKKRKKAFKRGKRCAICGKRKPLPQMMVAHKVPVRELSDWDALYDETNWEVRCITCEQRMNRQEAINRGKIE